MCAELKAGVREQGSNRRATQDWQVHGSACWNHLSSWRTVFSLQVYFSCRRVGVWGSCLGPDTWAASAQLISNKPLILETLVAWFHVTQNSLPPVTPSIPFPHAAWRWKSRMQNRKCAGDKERPRSHWLHRLGSGSQVLLSSMTADCLWNRCHPLLRHSLCEREVLSSRMGDNRH